ncbi:dimethylarginine dimethylaminohydrolase family protein [Myxococcus qinghaiensis]|uniref:dimethylarginine dimethylaminohydrolase family protein n=1 Tax=Myxococcus qinghaiensis TaxID=2906758 RepID=UPI0020A6F494|nr:arginine deiminase-related protein [Myxococcus qinghaiensis]MCP3168165.1 arginine deiminase-related protein [Myxococcus qinghaiensis]
MELFLMSPPGRGWALRGRNNFRSREAGQVDARKARREWLALARAIEARGGTVVALSSPSELLTGMPYAAECGQVVAREGAAPWLVLPRMMSAHRQAEKEHWAALARRMGFEVVEPDVGIWEAHGDVAHFDGATLVFWGGRTTLDGLEAASRWLPGEVVRVQVREPAFHGNMALLPLPAVDRMLVCPEVIADESYARLRERFGEERLLTVTEDEIRRYATNGLPVGRDLLAPSVVPEAVKARVEALGMGVVSLDMSELCEKGGGSSRCLVSRAWVEDGAVRIPDEARLSAVAKDIEADG